MNYAVDQRCTTTSNGIQKTLLSNYWYLTYLWYLKQVLDIFVLPDEFLLHRMPDHLIKQNYIIKSLKPSKIYKSPFLQHKPRLRTYEGRPLLCIVVADPDPKPILLRA
jgi:hypothetical protein